MLYDKNYAQQKFYKLRYIMNFFSRKYQRKSFLLLTANATEIN